MNNYEKILEAQNEQLRNHLEEVETDFDELKRTIELDIYCYVLGKVSWERGHCPYNGFIVKSRFLVNFVSFKLDWVSDLRLERDKVESLLEDYQSREKGGCSSIVPIEKKIEQFKNKLQTMDIFVHLAEQIARGYQKNDTLVNTKTEVADISGGKAVTHELIYSLIRLSSAKKQELGYVEL